MCEKNKAIVVRILNFHCEYDNSRTSWMILLKFGQEVLIVNILDVSKVESDWTISSGTFGTSPKGGPLNYFPEFVFFIFFYIVE